MIRLMLVVVGLSFGISVQAEQDPALAKLLSHWNHQISQGYQNLATETLQLQKATADFCRSPSEQALADVRQQWRQAFSSWQAIQWVNFGPVEQHSRAWQLQFWPDPKNLIARKVQIRLQQAEPATVADIAAEGVAVQGFPALEYLLFDQDFLNKAAVDRLKESGTCALVQAISDYLVQQAASLAQEWNGPKGFGERFLQGTHPFASQQDVLHRSLKAMMTHLEIIKDRKLATPMGLRGNQRINPFMAESWRSESSGENLQANLEALVQALGEAGLAGYLQTSDRVELAASLVRAAQEVQAEAKSAPDLAHALTGSEAIRPLQALYMDVEILHQLLVERIAPELGVQIGFNSNDGD